MKLSEIAQALGARLVGDGSLEIRRPVHPKDAKAPDDLALAMERSTLALLEQSAARAAIVAEDADIPDGLLEGYLVVGRPRYAMACLMDLFERPVRASGGVHATAVVEDGAVVGDGVSIGAHAFVGANARIGADTIVMDHVSIGAEARIGAGCLLHSGARVGERVILGARVILHHNASIGADGFSYTTPEDGSIESAKARGTVDAINTEIVRINSIGTVILEDGVEVGALSAVDRGTVAATVVGRNTKIDNLVTVGHNVVIGAGCLICGQVGISGSCTIGDRVVLGGQVGVADHLTIGDDAVIAAGSGVGTNVPPKSVYVGYPAVPKNKFAELLIYGNRLRPMFEDLAELKRRLKAIESGGGG
ncbi:MAG: UDP-3-O-(3-hydroxymyristoyl)glucosamine N-acyltransferase [Alphaproteobacteria bacterium]|nr:UDP-3-O-(3-hydroxymyristoyl)glucosamine N-acyltransferase [Alphaproteobacteria bacterium]